MANWIEHIVEPKRLYLAWQAPDHMGNRYRWAVGVIEPVAGAFHFRYLIDEKDFSDINQGRSLDELKSLGYAGYPAFKWDRTIHKERVIETFLRRLPPRSRSDFGEYLQQFRLPPDANVSDFALLGLTGAKLPSDGFSLVDPLDPQAEVLDRVIEIAGYRYHRPETHLRVDETVTFTPEPENPHDPRAVAIYARGKRVGYVNRLQAPAFRQWLETRKIEAQVERINGDQSRPLVYVFVRVRPKDHRLAA